MQVDALAIGRRIAHNPDVIPPQFRSANMFTNWPYPVLSSPESAPKFVVTSTISWTLWQITFSSKLASFFRVPQVWVGATHNHRVTYQSYGPGD